MGPAGKRDVHANLEFGQDPKQDHNRIVINLVVKVTH